MGDGFIFPKMKRERKEGKKKRRGRKREKSTMRPLIDKLILLPIIPKMQQQTRTDRGSKRW
jgi:hypothetical protein